MTFPDGRAEPGFERLVIAFDYAVFPVANLLNGVVDGQTCDAVLGGDPQQGVRLMGVAIDLLFVAVVVAALVRRWRRASTAAHRGARGGATRPDAGLRRGPHRIRGHRAGDLVLAA